MRKTFENYDEFYSDIITTPFVLSDSKKQVKHGLTQLAVSELMQYIEDLFSFMMTTKNIKTLIKDVVYYNPKDVGNYIRKFSHLSEEEKLVELKMPYFSDGIASEDAEMHLQYINLKKYTLRCLKKVIDFYQRYYQFYLQYKHGLKTQLNPWYDNEQYEIDSKKVDIWRYQQRKFWKSNKHSELITPPLHPCIEPLVDELDNEDNLLCSAIDTVSYDEIEKVAFTTYQLITCFHHNFVGMLTVGDEYLRDMLQVKTATNLIEVWFPKDDIKSPFIQIDFPYQ